MKRFRKPKEAVAHDRAGHRCLDAFQSEKALTSFGATVPYGRWLYEVARREKAHHMEVDTAEIVRKGDGTVVEAVATHRHQLFTCINGSHADTRMTESDAAAHGYVRYNRDHGGSVKDAPKCVLVFTRSTYEPAQ